MTDKVERPDIVTDEHLEYLDDLRESGVTNMFGAGSYLEDNFCLKPVQGTVKFQICNFFIIRSISIQFIT